MNTIHYTDAEVDSMVREIIRQLAADSWKPEYVVAISEGGLIPGLKLSRYFDVPLETLAVSHKNGNYETNCWMAEDALAGKNILIVNNINNSGKTFQWIKQDWQVSVGLEKGGYKWDSIWNESVRFAVLVDNEASDMQVNYADVNMNSYESPFECIFPWEEWWK